MSFRREPRHLRAALAEVIARRGLADRGGARQLAEMWVRVAGQKISQQTLVTSLRNGVLHVGVTNSVLLSELAGFHRKALLTVLRQENAGACIRDIRFTLKSSGRPTQAEDRS